MIILIILLLILSAFFSSAETALTSVSPIKLRALADEGSKSAAKVLKVSENKAKLLSTILVGNNVVNIAASALTTTYCTEKFGSVYLGAATGILTLLVLIFGEITPKTIATYYATGMSRFFVYPISWLMVILTPVIWVLNLITGVIFRLCGIPKEGAKETVTESELLTMVNVSHEEGVLEPEEKFMISNVVDFGDALSKDIMIPRTDMVCASIDTPYNELVKIFIEETFSRIPIYEDSKENIVGILYMKDLFFLRETEGVKSFDIKKIMRSPLFVYEFQKSAEIFSEMKESSVTMAVVLDEYGAASGLITMEDLIEEIVGEIRDEYDEDEDSLIVDLGNNTYDVDASVKLDDINDALSLKLASDDYDSLAGYMIELLDKLPEEGDEADTTELHLKVTKVERNRVERILLYKKEEKAEEN